MQATFYCHKEVITALLEAGADPTLAGHNGCTALGENKWMRVCDGTRQFVHCTVADLATLVDDSASEVVRLLATQHIQTKPPSLEMSTPALAARRLEPRAASVPSLQEGGGGGGGIKLWWEKFSGRFKRLNRVDEGGGGGEAGLQYTALLPASPVFTLGFSQQPRPGAETAAESSLLDPGPQFSHQRLARTQSFSATAATEAGDMPAGRGLHQTTLLRTKRLLHSNSVSLLPVSSPGLSKVSARHRIYARILSTVLCLRAGTGTGRLRATIGARCRC